MNKKRIEKLEAAIAPVERETLNDRVYRELKNSIMTGAFAPGDELILREVASTLGTSLMPVRDAMRRLVSERGLVALPSRKIAIPVMTSERFRELRRIRVLLEGEAASLAAERITKKQLSVIGLVLKKIEGLGPERQAEYLGLNQRLHFSVYEAASSPLLFSIIESLWLELGPILTRVPVSRAISISVDPHQRLFSALEQGDAEGARAALTDDLNHAYEQILAALLKRERV